MYRWVDHTAEVELRIEAPSQPEVFADALAALAELLDPDEERRRGPSEEHELSAEGGDRAALLAAWIEELLYLAETRRVLPLAAEGIELGEGTVRARIRCRPARPRPLVKGVTYHHLALERRGEGWEGRVVLDV